MADVAPLSTPPDDAPKFAVRISRGLVTHWNGHPLLTADEANEAREAILAHTGEDGEVEKVLLYV